MKGNRVAGLILIVLGGLYLTMQVLDEIGIEFFHFGDFWPLFTITVGLMFEIGYFQTKRHPGVLIPGGIITSIGLLHLFESLTNWFFAAYTWPLYVFALVVGFFHYWLVTRERWALVVSTILMAIVLFLGFIVASIIFEGIISVSMGFSVLLIVIGIIVLFSNKRNSD